MKKMTSHSLKSLFSLQGKVALVTGGAGFLGSEISDALAEQGASVIVASRDVEKCKIKAEELTSTYSNQSHYLQLDITSETSVESLVNFID